MRRIACLGNVLVFIKRNKQSSKIFDVLSILTSLSQVTFFQGNQYGVSLCPNEPTFILS